MQRSRRDLVWARRLCRESHVSGVPWSRTSPAEACPTCHGTGDVHVRRKGFDQRPGGRRHRFEDQVEGTGRERTAGRTAGDLIITFNVLPDKFYRRDGLDVIATVPLNIAQATLGTKISVRTLAGKKSLSRFGRELHRETIRVRGQGIRRREERH